MRNLTVLLTKYFVISNQCSTSYSDDLMSVSCTAVDRAETQINKDMKDNKDKDGQNKTSKGKEPGGNPSDKDEKYMSCEDRECHSPVERRHQQSKNRKCGPSEDGEQRLFKEGQHGPSEGGQSEPSKNLATQVGQRKLLADGEQGRCKGRNESLKQLEQEPSKNGKSKSSRHLGSGEHQPSVDAGRPSEIMKHKLDEEQMSSEKGQHDPSKSEDSESSQGLHSGAGERKASGGQSGSSEVVQKQVSTEVFPKKMKLKKILTRICRFRLPLKAKLFCCYQPSTKDD